MKLNRIGCRPSFAARVDTAVEDTLDQTFYLRDVSDVMPSEIATPSSPSTISMLIITHVLDWLAVRLGAASLLSMKGKQVSDALHVAPVSPVVGVFSLIQVITVFFDVPILTNSIATLLTLPCDQLDISTASATNDLTKSILEHSEMLPETKFVISNGPTSATSPSLLRMLYDMLHSNDDRETLVSLTLWYALLSNPTIPHNRLLIPHSHTDDSNGLLEDESNAKVSESELFSTILAIISQPHHTRLTTLQAAIDVLEIILNQDKHSRRSSSPFPSSATIKNSFPPFPSFPSVMYMFLHSASTELCSSSATAPNTQGWL